MYVNQAACGLGQPARRAHRVLHTAIPNASGRADLRRTQYVAIQPSVCPHTGVGERTDAVYDTGRRFCPATQGWDDTRIDCATAASPGASQP